MAKTNLKTVMHSVVVPPSQEPVLQIVGCQHAQTPYHLAYWQWGSPDAGHVLVCVHGLSRQGRDFDVLAQTLLRDAAERQLPPLRIICPDVPGRGRSDWFAQARWYQTPVYVEAMLQLLEHLEQQAPVTRLDWLGTSMGGLIGLGLAAMQKTPAWPLAVPLSRLVLNDVGPAIAPAAISRIAAYIGQPAHFASEEEAADVLRQTMSGFGPHTPEQWLALCRPQLRPHPRGGWQWHYDPAIGEAFRQDTPGQWEQAQAALWQIYDSLDIPVLLLRGADSDLLTRETANAMQQRGPRARCVEFAGIGHAPTLIVPEQARVVSKFLLNTAVS